MKIIEETAEKLDQLPELDELEKEELKELLLQVRSWKSRLDEHEPKSSASQSYEDWCDLHEELEDAEDDILDRLDE